MDHMNAIKDHNFNDQNSLYPDRCNGYNWFPHGNDRTYAKAHPHPA